MKPGQLRKLVDGPVEEVAANLLGHRLRTEFEEGVTEVEITEVEAYAGARDPASHAYRGRTARNESMFGPIGSLYVYRSYGIHWCMNIVTGELGDPAAVLIRAGTPITGEAIMVRRRSRPDNLADGPGKLAQALGVDGSLDGTSVLSGPVRLLEPLQELTRSILSTPRVGISKATSWPWRFVLAKT